MIWVSLLAVSLKVLVTAFKTWDVNCSVKGKVINHSGANPSMGVNTNYQGHVSRLQQIFLEAGGLIVAGAGIRNYDPTAFPQSFCLF